MMAVGDAYVFPGFLTPVLTQLFFPKPTTLSKKAMLYQHANVRNMWMIWRLHPLTLASMFNISSHTVWKNTRIL